MASEIRVDKINSLSGVGTVTLSPTGVDIAGITTAATLRATTGIVTSLTAGSLTSLGAVSGTTGTFTGGITATGGNIVMNDSSGSSANRIKLGTSQDLELYHNGSNSMIEDNGTGNLEVRTNGTKVTLQGGNNPMINAIKDGAVELYYNNSKKIETTNTGVSVTGNLDLSADNYKLRLGGGNDIELYTDGSHSYLNNENGNWYIHGSTGSNGQEILIRPKQAENSIRAIADGAVELYHDNTLKLSTTSSGVTVQNGNLALNRQDSGFEGGEIVFNRASDNANQWFNDVYGNDSSARIRWHHGNSEKAAFLTGGGITFNGDTAAANALDDYEEGTWTPTNSIGLTLTNDNPAYYLKIGKMVMIQFDVSFTGASDTAQCGIIQSLPFTAENTTNHYSQGPLPYISQVNNQKLDTSLEDLLLFIAPNDDKITIYSWVTSSAAARSLLVGRRIRHQMIYKAA